MWFGHNGTRINSSGNPNIDISSSLAGTVYSSTLTWIFVSYDAGGQYLCTVSNSVGYMDKMFDVQVNDCKASFSYSCTYSVLSSWRTMRL